MLPVFIVVVDIISLDGARMFAVAVEDLRREDEPTSTAEPERLHNHIHFSLKCLRQLECVNQRGVNNKLY